MRIVRIKGGLGNQMFQYTFALRLKDLTGEEVKLDYSACYHVAKKICEARSKQFQLALGEASKEEIRKVCIFPLDSAPFLTRRYRGMVYAEKALNRKYFFEPNRSYIDPRTILKYRYYDGYWQSWRYADPIRDRLIADFVPNYEMSDATKAMIRQVSSENSVFVGVRKGDYTATAAAQKHFGSFSNDYYLKAMNLISERVKDPVFYIFSNDIQWCKDHMDWGGHRIIYRNPEDQTSDFEELMIMSSCRNAVIINSTFHWWGAYLIRNPEKIVVCPDHWFFDGSPIDILPPYWTALSPDGGKSE